LQPKARAASAQSLHNGTNHGEPASERGRETEIERGAVRVIEQRRGGGNQ
jgi:hypothetical protein